MTLPCVFQYGLYSAFMGCFRLHLHGHVQRLLVGPTLQLLCHCVFQYDLYSAYMFLAMSNESQYIVFLLCHCVFQYCLCSAFKCKYVHGDSQRHNRYITCYFTAECFRPLATLLYKDLHQYIITCDFAPVCFSASCALPVTMFVATSKDSLYITLLYR